MTSVQTPLEGMAGASRKIWRTDANLLPGRSPQSQAREAESAVGAQEERGPGRKGKPGVRVAQEERNQTAV